MAIVLQAKKILEALSTIMEVPVPAGTHFTVCGDVHGQFFGVQPPTLSDSALPRSCYVRASTEPDALWAQAPNLMSRSLLRRSPRAQT
jgi:hypothetical protein